MSEILTASILAALEELKKDSRNIKASKKEKLKELIESLIKFEFQRNRNLALAKKITEKEKNIVNQTGFIFLETNKTEYKVFCNKKVSRQPETHKEIESVGIYLVDNRCTNARKVLGKHFKANSETIAKRPNEICVLQTTSGKVLYLLPVMGQVREILAEVTMDDKFKHGDNPKQEELSHLRLNVHPSLSNQSIEELLLKTYLEFKEFPLINLENDPFVVSILLKSGFYGIYPEIQADQIIGKDIIQKKIDDFRNLDGHGKKAERTRIINVFLQANTRKLNYGKRKEEASANQVRNVPEKLENMPTFILVRKQEGRI